MDNRAPAVRRAFITTLGSESAAGSIYIWDISDPVDLSSSISPIGRLRELASLNCTIWSADCNSIGNRVVIGTNLGGTLLNVETGVPSVLCHSKSDVLSVQLIQAGNVVLCGLRNGAIVTVDLRVDIRQRQRPLSKYRIRFPSGEVSKNFNSTVPTRTKRWFELQGHVQPSYTTFLPSSISCLTSLELYDQYFLASSMDGSIKLYDHRLIERGPVQSYEGHVNSHTRIQLGVDPYEKFVLSGGEDKHLRMWSIKSGEMLFQGKLLNSIPSTVCWKGRKGSPKMPYGRQMQEASEYRRNYDTGAWIGSSEGLCWMQFPWL